MANIKEIQDRIKSVNDTMKITSAMYMISSNKLRKARKMLAETEPFFYSVQGMFSRVVRHVPADTQDIFLDMHSDIPKEKRKKGYIVLTDDKGLAGAYNHNVLKIAEEHVRNDGPDWRLYVVGEMGRQYFMNKRIPVDEQFHFTAQNPTLSRARNISSRILDDYMNQELDEVYMIYTTMKNSIVCETQFFKLLPLDRKDAMANDQNIVKAASAARQEEFLMTPSPEAVLDNIVPSLVTGFIYGALVEAYCSVQNSRMMAMDSANKNAKSMIHELTMKYNRERQGMITQEITEVASGAKALKRAKQALEEQNAMRQKEMEAIMQEEGN